MDMEHYHEAVAAIVAATAGAWPELAPPDQVAAIRERYGLSWEDVARAAAEAARLFERRPSSN
jgi:hypothetical protein